MKLFKTKNIETVNYCRMQFNFDLASTILRKRSDVFFAGKYRLCSNTFCTVVINVLYNFYLFVFFHYLLSLSDDE